MDFRLDQLPVTLASHPTKNFAAVGCIDGSMSILSFDASTSLESNSVAESWTKKHKAPFRKIRFSASGDQILALTRNRTLTIRETESGKKSRIIRNISSQGARPYCMRVLSEHQLAVGDEKGIVRVFDWRCHDDPPCIAEISDHETDQYLTDMTSDCLGRTLLATCGDGTLIAYDVRKKKSIVKSELMHDELLSVVVAKNETKLFCGSADGYIEEFNWNEWGNLIERIDSKHTDTVDSLVKLDEDLLASGSADGTIRLHHVVPNKMLKVIGRHDENSPIEELAVGPTVDNNPRWLLSCGHDNKVKFWDSLALIRWAPRSRSGSNLKKFAKKSSHSKNSDFFDDLAEKSDDNDSESEDDSEMDDDSDRIV